MFNYCPFFPNEINPCGLHNCQFRCAGGCAISLAAYAKDAFDKSEEIDQKTDETNRRLRNLESDVRQIKNQTG